MQTAKYNHLQGCSSFFQGGEFKGKTAKCNHLQGSSSLKKGGEFNASLNQDGIQILGWKAG